ncbi:MAG: electron transfer flavoprotein subunit alpha/FixB family protein, partial [Ilumatobacteraceae bacterium]
VLVVIDHDRGTIAPTALGAITAGRNLASSMNTSMEALTIGATADSLVDTLAAYGASVVHQAHHEILVDYGPEAWGETVAQFVRSTEPQVVVGCGTERGHEVIAQAAARLDLPAVMNCTELTLGDGSEGFMTLTRNRWGGSLLEQTELDSPIKFVTIANYSTEPIQSKVVSSVKEFVPSLDESFALSIVRDRVERIAGVTLATSPVVVSGGRGVGSAEGFAPLEELAALLGGVVGCSRAVTNNGWRNHTDQVGQTGTRIAPDIYIACGISGAIQHWVGAMASKNILAINIDKEANIVTKAGYAVIGDLHTVVPAICEEIKRRRGES